MTGFYSARVRKDNLTAGEGVLFRTATLVENYGRPDMLMITGRQNELRSARVPGYGMLLSDETRTRRFSGILTSIEEDHTGLCSLVYSGDLVRLWWRVCYPVPAAPWTTAGQNVAYDTVDDDAETKLLHYIDVNAGPSARAERRFAGLTVPASSGRGPVSVTNARFDTVGVLTAALAEAADLRLQIVQTYLDGVPELKVVLTPTPDLTQSHRFGTARTSPQPVGKWKTKIELPAVTTALSAAGGLGNARLLNDATDADAEDLWSQRIESVIDQSSTSAPSEIAAGLQDALMAGAGPVDASLELADNATIRAIPLGARFTAKLGNAIITDRLRQRITTIGADGATKTVKAVFGDPDAGFPTPQQRDLARERRRVQKLESR